MMQMPMTMMHDRQSMIVQGLLVDKPNEPKIKQGFTKFGLFKSASLSDFQCENKD